MIDPCLKDSTSIAAYNKDGEIIGTRSGRYLLPKFENFLTTFHFRMGEIFDERHRNVDPDLRWMASLPSWCFPKKMITLGMTVKFCHDAAKYGKNLAFVDVPKGLSFCFKAKSIL